MDAFRPVKMCVCAGVTFAKLRDAGITSVEEAREKFGCAKECGNCRPYIEQMLATGEVAFPVLMKLPEMR